MWIHLSLTADTLVDIEPDRDPERLVVRMDTLADTAQAHVLDGASHTVPPFDSDIVLAFELLPGIPGEADPDAPGWVFWSWRAFLYGVDVDGMRVCLELLLTLRYNLTEARCQLGFQLGVDSPWSIWMPPSFLGGVWRPMFEEPTPTHTPTPVPQPRTSFERLLEADD